MVLPGGVPAQAFIDSSFELLRDAHKANWNKDGCVEYRSIRKCGYVTRVGNAGRKQGAYVSTAGKQALVMIIHIRHVRYLAIIEEDVAW